MRTSTYILYALVGLVALCHVGLTSPVVKRQVLDNPKYIDPAEQDLETNEEQDRGKRKIEGAVELTYGAKNAILGLLFNKTYKLLLSKPKFFHLPAIPVIPPMPLPRHKRAVASAGTTHTASRTSTHVVQRRQGNTVVARETTTEDIVNFTPGQKVSLEVPDQLFGSGFSLITNISQIVGSLIQNSAERTARVFETMKPFLQNVFGVRSLTITRDGPKNNAV